MKLHEAIELFLNHCKIEKNLNTKSIKAYKIDLNQFINLMQDIEIEDIGKEKIRKFLNELYDKKYKIKTIKRKIVSIKALFNFLEFEEIITSNPFRKIKIKLTPEKALPKVLSIQDIENILRYAYSVKNKDKFSKRNILILELLISCGIRIFELVNIKLEDINLKSGTILIQGKGNKERIIYIINKEVLELLKLTIDEFQIKSGYLFLNRNNKQISDQSIRNMVKKYALNCGIHYNVTPHIFRHTFATLLLNEGIDIRHIQLLLGHNSILTTQIYTHLNENIKREILKKHPRNYLNF